MCMCASSAFFDANREIKFSIGIFTDSVGGLQRLTLKQVQHHDCSAKNRAARFQFLVHDVEFSIQL